MSFTTLVIAVQCAENRTDYREANFASVIDLLYYNYRVLIECIKQHIIVNVSAYVICMSENLIAFRK